MPSVIEEPALGWNPDKEELHSYRIAANAPSQFLCEAPSDIPDTMEVSWFRQKVQGVLPFCHSHMRTAIVKFLAWLATEGQVTDFSRLYAAITDMIKDGTNPDTPAGASIGGSLQASVDFGEALESLFPYPEGFDDYSSHIPSNVSENAKLHHIQGIFPSIRDYDAMDKAMVSGNCAVAYGMDWGTGWDAVRGVRQLAHVPFMGRVRGGHAMAAFGWITVAGERWYKNHNSHFGWGVDNACYYSPEVWEYILRNSRFGAYIVSNVKLDNKPMKSKGWGWLHTANFNPTAPIKWS